MAKHAHTTPTSAAPRTSGRRSLFGAVTALACIPVLGVSAVPDPDAGLVRLCNAFHEAHDASHATDDASWEVHLDRRTGYADAIEGMAATTEAGKIAKGRVAMLLFQEGNPEAEADDCGRMVLSILRDLVGADA
ncbi:MAG: hypothetical protein ACRYGM_05285 [Janthinobacterium lividum]